MQKNFKAKLNNPQRVPASRYALFLFLAAAGCLADLFTKNLVFQRLGMPGESAPYWLISNYVGIETSLNTGALFGIGQNRVEILAIISIVALVGIILWFVFSKSGNDLFLTSTLGVITGGILGNLYDRLGLWAQPGPDGERFKAVRDWILFQYSDDWKWPNFNIADSLLVCGAAVLFFASMRADAKKQADSDAQDE